MDGIKIFGMDTNRIARLAAQPRWFRALNRRALVTVQWLVHAVKGTRFGQQLISRLNQASKAVGNRRSLISVSNASGAPKIGIIIPEYVKTDVRIYAIVDKAKELGFLAPVFTTAREITNGTDTSDFKAVLVRRDGVDFQYATKLLTHLHKSGIRLVVDLDDDMLSDENRDRLVKDGNYTLDALAALTELCQHADQIISSTEPLAKTIAQFTDAPIEVFPNLLDPKTWAPLHTPKNRKLASRVPKTKTRLLYFGTLGRSGDLEVIKNLPTQIEMATKHKTIVELLGITTDKLPKGFDSLITMNFPYHEFVAYLKGQANRWEVGLAPLAENTYNNARSDLKLLEYAALGIPAVASRVGPYYNADDLAVLVENSAAEWCAAVEKLLTDATYAQERVTKAQEVVLHTRMVTADAARRWANLVLGNESQTAFAEFVG